MLACFYCSKGHGLLEMIDKQRRLIFVENPKTATNSVKIALMGKENLYNPFDSRIATVGHHVPAILKKRYSSQWQDYTSFVVIRNTWDRAYSFFNFYCKTGALSYQRISFDEWVEKGCPPPDEGHLRSLMRAWGIFDRPLCQLQYAEEVDEVILLNSFDATERHNELCTGLNQISTMLNFPLKDVPTDTNHSDRVMSSEIWNGVTVECIAELFSDEIQHFGFMPPVH